jgi:hypothetical protein
MRRHVTSGVVCLERSDISSVTLPTSAVVISRPLLFQRTVNTDLCSFEDQASPAVSITVQGERGGL